MGKWPVRSAHKGARRWRVKVLIRKHRGKCADCGTDVTLEHNTPNQATIDHVVPLSKGGEDQLHNLRLLCRSCNLRKGDTVLDDDGEAV